MLWESLPGWVTWALLAMAEQKGVKPNVKELREALIGRVNNDVIENGLQKQHLNKNTILFGYGM